MPARSVLDPNVLIYVTVDDVTGIQIAEQLLEEGSWIEFKKGYRVRADKPHASGQDHYHIFQKGRQVCIVNRDGSPSHGTDVRDMPGWLTKKMQTMKLIDEAGFLFIETAGSSFSLPQDLINEATKYLNEKIRIKKLFEGFGNRALYGGQ